MNWQDYLAIAFFTAAAMYVAWRAWRAIFLRGKAGCGTGCSSCGSARAPQQRDLLTIAPKDRESRS